MNPSQHDPHRQRRSYQQHDHRQHQHGAYNHPEQYQPPRVYQHQQGHYQQGHYLPKPGKVQAIAVMSLVDGILNVLWALSLGAILMFVCLSPLALYPLFVGIYSIIYASKLLSSNPVGVRPDKTLPILQIINVLSGNMISLVVGILNLVFMDDPEVQQYYAAINYRQPYRY